MATKKKASKKKSTAKKKASKKKTAKRPPRKDPKKANPSVLLAPAKPEISHYDPEKPDDSSPFAVAPANREGPGRPPKFEPQFCKMAFDHMAGGYSFESFAGLIGVAISTLYLWAKTYPEFSEAKERGLAASLHWWENAGLIGLTMPSKAWSSAVWSRNMNARFAKQGWRDGVTSGENENDEQDYVADFG